MCKCSFFMNSCTQPLVQVCMECMRRPCASELKSTRQQSSDRGSSLHNTIPTEPLGALPKPSVNCYVPVSVQLSYLSIRSLVSNITTGLFMLHLKSRKNWSAAQRKTDSHSLYSYIKLYFYHSIFYPFAVRCTEEKQR